MILATTTITVEESDGGDPYEPVTWTAVVTGQPAHIGAPNGSEAAIGGQLESIDAVLLTASGLPLTHEHRIIDEGTEDVWAVSWVQKRQGLGLDHTKAGLGRFDGGASSG